ncbi:MAG: hypothetical protein ABSE73_15445 [Planctomycetota bacterium]
MAAAWSGRNLSGTRDAVLIHGLALLAACTGSVLAFILRPDDEAYGPGLGVALSATVVFLVWSLTLAVRAWRRGERSGWSWAVMVLGGFETVFLAYVVFLVWYMFPYRYSTFQWTLETGVIVILPVGAIACLAAMPVTWWRLRCAAARDEMQIRQIRGHDPDFQTAGNRVMSPDLQTTGNRVMSPDLPRSHWKRGLIWFCAVAALPAAVLLPWPLFIYFASWEQQRPVPTWKTWVLEHTPAFVAETTAGALTLSSHELAVSFYDRALQSGRVSKSRLLAEVNSTNFGTQQCAFYGLIRADTQAALALADQIGQGKPTKTFPFLRTNAGELMGQHGTAERIRYFLDQAGTSPPPSGFMDGLLRGLHRRPEFLPEVFGYCRKDLPNRESALYALTCLLPPQDLPGAWAEFLADSDPVRRQHAIKTIPNIRDVNARLASLAAGLESPDPAVRQEVLKWLQHTWWVLRDCKSCDPALVTRMVQALLPDLDDADRSIRCAGARSLVLLVDDRGTLQKEFNFFDNLPGPLASTFSQQETPLERKMLEAIRAAARKWLEKHVTVPSEPRP